MTSATLLAEWSHDLACSSLRTCVGCCLRTAGTLWPESFTDWPDSATWDRGGLFELPTSEPRTDASACSSWLLSPTVGDASGGGRADPPPRGTGTKQGSGGLREQVRLLPTPAAHEPGGTAEQYHARLKAHDGRDPTFLPLSMAVQLLPTPRTSDTNGAGSHGTGGPDLRTVIGDLTARQSPDGSTSWDEPPLPQSTTETG